MMEKKVHILEKYFSNVEVIKHANFLSREKIFRLTRSEQLEKDNKGEDS